MQARETSSRFLTDEGFVQSFTTSPPPVLVDVRCVRSISTRPINRAEKAILDREGVVPVDCGGLPLVLRNMSGNTMSLVQQGIHTAK